MLKNPPASAGGQEGPWRSERQPASSAVNLVLVSWWPGCWLLLAGPWSSYRGVRLFSYLGVAAREGLELPSQRFC